jgi:hypothetical protein
MALRLFGDFLVQSIECLVFRVVPEAFSFVALFQAFADVGGFPVLDELGVQDLSCGSIAFRRIRHIDEFGVDHLDIRELAFGKARIRGRSICKLDAVGH